MGRPRFFGSAAGQAPLMLQLSVPAGRIGRVMEATADGENTIGAASLASLSRPSTPGVGTSTPVGSKHPGAVTSFSFFKSYTSAPTFPALSTGSFNLPRHFRRVYGQDGEFWLLPGTSGLLYANATGGHTWTGTLTFEEL